MSVAESFFVSIFLLLPGWLSLGAGMVFLVLALRAPKRNRYR